MKTRIKNLFFLPALIAGLGLMLAGQVTAQTFTNLHSFPGYYGDGTGPRGTLILAGNTLYGTTVGGGTNGSGTVFAINVNGTGYTNLYGFTVIANPYPPQTNSDGAGPSAGLILSGNTLYGTTSYGGNLGHGTVFAINTNGSVFTNLYSFDSSEGNSAVSSLILSGNALYGTVEGTGVNGAGYGTVFKVNTDGSSFTNLHSFTAGGFTSTFVHTNSDGALPAAGLILSGNTLYGTASVGGTSGEGTVFAINTDGSSFTNLHNFQAIPSNYPNTNSDGAYPKASLLLSGNTLYGTTSYGGGSGSGTLFAINADGTGFTNFYNFTAIPTFSPYTNKDGAAPAAALILSGNTLYGTAGSGGSFGVGTVFTIYTNGMGFTNLYNFTGGSNGGGPVASLILSGNILYGTGTTVGTGTVFALSLPIPPSIGITKAGNKIILSWPTNASTFTLQTITNLASGSWSNITSGITIVGTNYVFTNAVNGNASFFRLKQ